MLTINLLPDSARPARRRLVARPNRTILIGLGVVLFLALALMPALLVPLRTRTLARLNGKIEALRQQRVAMDRMQRLLERLREQEAAFSGLPRQGGSWSQRLNTLSDVAPEGVWFDELVLEPNQRLVVHGSAIAAGGTEMMRVGRLVQQLKADAGFAAVVQDIQIESIKRVQERETEVVKFTLACALTDQEPG